ncbi:MAG: DUF4359 domain-containing protein [Chlorobi bacterium]|nr:DUF4359 domain-containing protein [Chlorobiota bacterium]
MRTFIWILLIAAGLLILTNPGRDRFREFVKTEAVKFIEEKDGKENPVARVVMPFFAPWMARTFERDNYLLFSVYRLGDFKVLGIAGRFIPLNTLDENDVAALMSEMNRDLMQVSEEDLDRLAERMFDLLLNEEGADIQSYIEQLVSAADTLDLERLQKEWEEEMKKWEKAGMEFLEELNRLQESQNP